MSDCTCVFVCCPGLDDVCEPNALGLCSPNLETEAWDGMLLEDSCEISKVSCRFPCEFGVAALEVNALVSGCAVEAGWDKVKLFPSCSAVDDWVVCGTIPFAVV